MPIASPTPDYTTPTENFDTPVSAATTGLNFGRAQDAAMQGALPAAQMLAADSQVKEKASAISDQNAAAAKYQQLLDSGVSGAKAYVADLAKEHPEIAADFNSRLDTVAPWLNTLKGEERVKAFHEMYDNVNSRVVAAKMGGMLSGGVPGQDGKMIPPTSDQLTSTMQNPKDMIASRIKGETADTGAKKVSAMSDYYKAIPAMKEKIAEIGANAKTRAAQIRANNSGSSAKFQYTMDTAQTNLKSVNDDIQKLTASDPAKKMIDPDTDKPMAESDPRYQQMAGLMRESVGWNKQMSELIKERNTYQTWSNHASEKGAKPGDSIDTKEANALEPTAKSTDDEIGKWLRYKKQSDDPLNIQFMRLMLGGDSAQVKK